MKRKKRVLLIGRSAAGKTTLCQRIGREDLRYHKTQTIQVFGDAMIDTPGEYLERTRFRGALMVTAADADLIAFLQDATEEGTMFPPAYSSTFPKPVIGIVTKCDLADARAVNRAREYLTLAGAGKMFLTSSLSGEGIDELVAYLGYDYSGGDG